MIWHRVGLALVAKRCLDQACLSSWLAKGQDSCFEAISLWWCAKTRFRTCIDGTSCRWDLYNMGDVAVIMVLPGSRCLSMCIALSGWFLMPNRRFLDIFAQRSFPPLLTERIFLCGRTNAVHGLFPSLLDEEISYIFGSSFSDPHIDGLHA